MDEPAGPDRAAVLKHDTPGGCTSRVIVSAMRRVLLARSCAALQRLVCRHVRRPVRCQAGPPTWGD
jgi:hypothetical protein